MRFRYCECCLIRETIRLYLGLEEPRPALEFLLTLEEYDELGNVDWYSEQGVYLVEVIEDRGEHLDTSFEEIEEY